MSSLKSLLASTISATVAFGFVVATPPAQANEVILTTHTATAYALDISRPFELGDLLVLDPGFPFSFGVQIEGPQTGKLIYDQTARYELSITGRRGLGPYWFLC